MSSTSMHTRSPGEASALVNFGGNQAWQTLRYVPRDATHVLEILGAHRAERVRAVGSLHSWSDVAVARGVTLDMRRINHVEYDPDDGTGRVRVGAGCTLGELLDYLRARAGRTLPTMGVIKRQTIAGLLSTGTHGSGRPSVANFVTAVRSAAFAADGTPTTYEDRAGETLRAVRCGLGSLGVLLSVELRTVPLFRVRETVQRMRTVGDVLALYADHPLTQFALVPYSSTIVVWQRAPLTGAGFAGVRAWFFRAFNVLGVDIGFHLLLKASLVLGGWAVRALMAALPYMLIAGVSRVDDAEHVLTQLHYLFRHEEMELFVPESKVEEAAQLLQCAIASFAGDEAAIPVGTELSLRAAGLYDELLQGRGTYVHHYPMLFRRVLPDDTLMSMTSAADEPWFSFSLFTYDPPGNRSGYYRVCSWVARAMHSLFAARLHWGKHYPLSGAETARMYPGIERFKELCRERDPAGVFRSEFTARVLELP